MSGASKKILFISYDGMTDPLGQSQVIPYLQGLSNKGFEFHLLSCEKPETFRKNKATIEKLLTGYAITWHPVPYTKKPPVLSTIKDVVQLRKKAAQIHKKYGIDMVHTRPGIPALIGLMLKKKFAVKFLHDIREFYADSRVEGGIWNIKNPLFRVIYNYFKKKEKEEVKLCDGIVCLTHAAEKITAALPEYKKAIPLKVIPCSVDLQLFDPAAIKIPAKEKLQQQLGIRNGDVVISYLGSVGGWYMTHEMMRFCSILAQKKPEIKFLFISPHLHDVITAEAAKHGIPAEKIIVQHAKRIEVPLLLSLSHYSLFFIKPCYSKLSSSPTKHGEIMAMGIPVITNSGVGDVKEIVTQYNAGFVADGFEDKDFTAIINSMYTATFNPADIRKGAVEYYSLEKAVTAYTDMYNSILN